jgi:hypothetical protein
MISKYFVIRKKKWKQILHLIAFSLSKRIFSMIITMLRRAYPLKRLNFIAIITKKHEWNEARAFW